MGVTLARLALVVSANVGVATDEPLHYADDDGDRVAEVLTDLGGVAPDDLFRVRSASVDDVTAALGRAVLRASALREAGQETELLLYYTGHAGTDGLHLEGEVLPLPSLKTAARVVPASNRVFVVDACQAGQLLRSKGATLVTVDDRPADFAPPPDEAWIASTGPEERAFEVDKRRGALFTHFFVSGARGAADGDADGSVTLGELYTFVQTQTEVAAAGHGVVQRPRWAGDLESLVFTSPGASGSGLEAVGPVPDPILVVDIDKGSVAAELPAGAGGRIALPPGRYQLLTLVRGKRTKVADVSVSAGAFRQVSTSELREVAGIRTKGGLVDTHPWNVAVGYVASAGMTPGRTDGHGAWLGMRRSLGRGHRVELGLEAGSVGVWTDAALGRDEWAGARAQWGYDLQSHGVRFGPGLELGAGGLRQHIQRAPDAVWGAWYGSSEAGRTAEVAWGRGLAGLGVEVPMGPLWLVGFGGGGVAAFTSSPLEARPMAQLRLGVAVSR